jgi:hypothetical protein
MKSERDGIDPAAKPSGTGCVECSAVGGWWLHLRRCVECGHVGCCDTSPNQHASKHNAATGHPIITSFEPGERWFYDYRTGEFFARPEASRPSLASVGSTGARTGRSGAFKLANSASRIGGGSLVLMSATGTNRRSEVGQSMSALPGYFRHQLVPLLPKHRLLRFRDI